MLQCTVTVYSVLCVEEECASLSSATTKIRPHRAIVYFLVNYNRKLRSCPLKLNPMDRSLNFLKALKSWRRAHGCRQQTTIPASSVKGQIRDGLMDG